jgi:hypothetical protein
MLLNNSEYLKAIYSQEWYMSIILSTTGILTIIYTSVRVGRHIPLNFSIALLSYIIIYLARFFKTFLKDKKYLIELRTFTTTTTICALDFIKMFFIYEIACFKAKLTANTHLEYLETVLRLQRQRNALLVLAIFIDASKIYTDVTHLQGYSKVASH